MLMRKEGDNQAMRAHLEWLEQARQEGDGWLEADLLMDLAVLAWEAGDAVATASRWKAAIRIYEAYGALIQSHTMRARLAEALEAVGQPAEARQMAEAVLAAWQAQPPIAEIEDDVRQSYLSLAHTFARLGESQIARACLERGHTFMLGRASRITNDARRQLFMNVPVNRKIEAELAKLEPVSVAPAL
jgi:tetratricopeptide (TPR) repeat protein